MAPRGTIAAEVAASGQADPPSSSTALVLSLGTTAAGLAAGLGLTLGASSDEARMTGLAIGGLALVVGPSTGHFYVGQPRQWTMWTRLGLTAASFAAFTSAIAIGFGCAFADHDDESYEECASDADGFAVLAGLFAFGVVGLAAYDIVDSPFAARRAQARQLSLRALPRRGGGVLTADVRF